MTCVFLSLFAFFHGFTRLGGADPDILRATRPAALMRTVLGRQTDQTFPHLK